MFNKMNRRLFLSLFTKGVLAYTFNRPALRPSGAFASQTNLEPKSFQGINLDSWKAIMGDANFPIEGANQVTEADLDLVHFDQFSELRANVNYGLKQVHNLTYLQETDENGFDYTHSARFEFRLPFETTADLSQDSLGQTIEGGLFIWDGSDTRLDYGAAFQLLISPFEENHGQINIWSANGDEGRWVDTGLKFAVDEDWHQLDITLNFEKQAANIKVDNLSLPVEFTSTTRPADWTTTTDARLQVEIISLFPGDNAEIPFPRHRLEVRNFFWKWRLLERELFLPILNSFTPTAGQ